MKYSEIKNLKTFTTSLVSEPDYKEVLENVLDSVDDFEVENVRFIKAECIDQILADELESNLYCLGCFNASFISKHAELDQDLIEIIQGAEAYEKLGEYIKNNCDLFWFAESYASADGYGHHFNSYDFGEEEITLNGVDYFVFDNQ